jgi:hypothetical protein
MSASNKPDIESMQLYVDAAFFFRGVLAQPKLHVDEPFDDRNNF